MSLAGELAKYAGGELAKAGSKELAKAGASSMLSSLVPNMATKVGTEIATKAGADIASKGVLNSLVPSIRTNWNGAGDIEGMLNGKFLGTNDYYFPSTFSEGALGRATYGPDQPIDQKKVAGLVRAIKNNEDIAPIAGFKNDDGLIDIYDGHHRLAAYQKAGKMPRVKLFTRETKDQAYTYADEWAKNAAKDVQQYLPAKPEAGLNEYGMGTIDLRHLNEPKVQQSIELSPEQLEFFKDSKLRDANGQLIPVYHSTPADFTVFDNAKLGENTGYDNTALGHFVTTDKDFSSRFKDIDGKGIKGRTMELYANVKNPITHPYMAGQKYDEAELDKIVEDYLIATDNQEFLQTLREYAKEDGSTIYDEYMDMTFGGDSPFEFSGDERDLLQNKGYDAVEIVEGPKSGLVEGSNDNTPVSSYAIFDGANLKDIRNLKPTSNPDVRMSYGYSGGYGSYDENVKRVGSSAVAPVREETLPEGWKELEKYLDTADKRLEKALGKPRSKITKQDLITFLEDYGYDTEGTKDDLWKNALMCIDDMALDDLYNAGGSAGMFLQDRLPFRHNDKITDATNYYIGAKGRTGRLDAEYSDRLGIGRSNTPMSDRLINPTSGAGGDYAKGAFGTDATWASGESGVSTSAHERLHAWQDINKFDWDEEVVDAIDELRGELKKFYHDEDTIKKYWGNSKTDYYKSDIEQEARMLQSYLDNEGYTNTYRKTYEKGTEWGKEVKPAFDKFFKKLRALSKKGIALPAVAGLVGIGALAGKKDDKKLDNVE